MNRLTAIGLASLVAYGLLLASKYAGFVPGLAADKGPRVAAAESREGEDSGVLPVTPEPNPRPVAAPAPVPRIQPVGLSPAALEFRAARDLKAYADALAARKASLNGDERYHLAKALEECQFVTSINEDLAAYSAKQRRQFIAGLPVSDPLNTKRIAAYDSADNTQRCMRFAGTRITAKDIEDLYYAAAQQGDTRAQARIVVAELNNKGPASASRADTASAQRATNDEFARVIGLLETHDPEAMLIVGQFLAQSANASQLRIGPNGEVPEPAAFLGAFSLVACDMGPDCVALTREPQMACAYGGYCTSTNYEELYQNFLASPWVYSQAIRYRGIILTAIETRNWALLGLVPPSSAPNQGPQ